MRARSFLQEIAMTKSRHRKQTIEFEHSIKVQVRRITLRRSGTLAYLDIEKLGRASKAEFEVGHIKEGKTHRAVLAVIKKGMVIGLRMEDCPQCKSADLTPELHSLFDEALRRMEPSNIPPSRPVPVREFLAELRLDCFLFCLFGICIICCRCCAFKPITIGGCTIFDGRVDEP
jgi:hypothetical protein